jgi:hypothetical protein
MQPERAQTGVPSAEELRAHLDRLQREAAARATSSGFEIASGLRLADCGLVLTALGQYLGYRVHGLDGWKAYMASFPGQLDPVVDAGELAMPYPGTVSGTVDYAWVRQDGRVDCVFEIDGRDNSPSQHLPRLGEARIIKQHIKPGAAKNFATLSFRQTCRGEGAS